MRGAASAVLANVIVNGLQGLIGLDWTWLGDKDKTCSDSDDLLFFEGNGVTQNTVGSIPTWEWNGDYNYARCVILFLKQIS